MHLHKRIHIFFKFIIWSSINDILSSIFINTFNEFCLRRIISFTQGYEQKDIEIPEIRVRLQYIPFVPTQRRQKALRISCSASLFLISWCKNNPCSWSHACGLDSPRSRLQISPQVYIYSYVTSHRCQPGITLDKRKKFLYIQTKNPTHITVKLVFVGRVR